MILRYLSYPLTRMIPTYGSPRESIEINPLKSIEKGDPCRTYWVGFQNHWGTHVDCPAHFDEHGKRVQDYDCNFWYFESPQVIQIDAHPGQILTIDDLKDDPLKGTDLLVLQSGWRQYRGTEVYSCRNPGLHPDLGRWLRDRHPSIRAVGIDWISISSYQHRDLGREAHRAFLNEDGRTRSIVLIEDMDLSMNLDDLDKVQVAPLNIENIDSAPCTVIGLFNEK